jgi:ankyrin repeat protein
MKPTFEEVLDLDACGLHDAAGRGDLAEVERLLAAGMQVNRFDELGKTPLHHAAAGGHLEVMRRLLSAGADVNACDDSQAGDSPLAAVAQNCSYEVALCLIQAGADPTLPGWMQVTALQRAERRRKPEGRKVYELLLETARHPDRVRKHRKK